MMPIGFGRAICGDLDQAERREWWITNGRGGYAAGTIAGSLTRTYHGLLVAPIVGALGRVLLFAKADAFLEENGRSWPLCTNRWGSAAVEPRGFVHIEHFAMDHAIPRWRYAVGNRVIEAAIWMEQGRNTSYIAWRLLTGPPAILRVTLLANRRDHHGGACQISALHHGPSFVEVSGEQGPPLRISASGGELTRLDEWFEDFRLLVETERGLHDRDRHRGVGSVRFPLVPGRWVGLTATAETEADADLPAALARRQIYDRAVVGRAQGLAQAPGWVLRLVLAADAFMFDRAQGPSVIAGYPWFTDWGRDSMIALPGLTLATGRPDRALGILRTFGSYLQQGLLPNVFPGDGTNPEYNTADATLWFIEAWQKYFSHTNDLASVQEAFPHLQDIIAWHLRGTNFGIGADTADGLLAAGAAGVQLTWMDAKVNGHVITKRASKPVEINALWFNALCVMADFAERLGADPTPYRAQSDRVRQSFAQFIRPDGNGLFDVLDPADPAGRPNQILAVSLTHSPLDPAIQRRVVDWVGRNLLCSVGLRSLAADDAAYCPTYRGDVTARDGAYHQGTVWAWLLGHFALAHHKVFGDPAAATAWLQPIADHLLDAGLGTVSEIFDAEPPHNPRGCPAQAWSVATVLEAWWRLNTPPKPPANDAKH